MVTGAAIGMGCMRVSTDLERPEEEAVEAILRAALEAGVNWLDTAHAYGLDDAELGHNEGLVAKARRPGVTIVTKVGMRRPKGRWVPDGRRKTLMQQAEASCHALGEPPEVMLLHAPDPKTSLKTSARAMRAIRDAGLAKAVGLSNVRFDELVLVEDIVPVSVVEVALSPLDGDSVRGGVVEHCLSQGIRVLAHSPLGGPKRARRLAKRPVLVDIATQRGEHPLTIALAWLYGLHPGLTPIPGVRRIETARLAGHAAALELDAEEKERLDAAFPHARLLRTPRETRRVDPATTTRRVVVMMGVPAAGKSGRARALESEGFLRLNRDEAGGSLQKLAATLDEELRQGVERVVMDNTYPTRAQRNRVIETAWEHGVPVDCVWLDTPLHEAQVNAVDRMLARYGTLLSPEAMRASAKLDPNTFGPRAQFRFRDALEPPSVEEGFALVERVAFARATPAGHDRAGFVYDLDAWTGQPPEGPTLVMAWKPGASEAELATLEAELALPEDATLAVCPHPAGPPICWCRKPLPGLIVSWMRTHRIDPGRSRYIGPSSADATLAERLGIPYRAST